MRDNFPLTSSSSTPNLMMRDWRTALRSPPPYRIGNRTFRFNFHVGFLILSATTLVLLFIYFNQGSTSSSDFASWSGRKYSFESYNSTYPLTPSIFTRGGVHTYRIGLIADLDLNSKIKDQEIWRSFYKRGHLSYTPEKALITINWDDGEPFELQSSYSLKGRGMELSELVTFNGHLLTFDDRTGLVYEIQLDKVFPWLILTDGNGKTQKGFKSEWATVKDHLLYVGSMGKEWTTSQGEFVSEDPMWVKAITPNGEIKHLDFSSNYKILREEVGITWPGYLIHESVVWSELNRNWYFLPRRCSTEKYNETKDEQMGCNVLISSDEYFSKIKITKIGKLKPTHGYSSFKFIPNTDDKLILAINTEELNGKTSTYLTVFTIEGNILLNEIKVSDTIKYEGIEFI